MADTYISEQMRAAIGTQTGREVSYPVSESDIRRWAIAVYYPEPAPRQFWDAEYAKTTQYGGIVAPEDFNPFAWLAAEPDESLISDGNMNFDYAETALGIEGPGLKFVLNGGIEVEYGVPMRPGDVITSVSRLADYRERTGRLGLMLFTISETTWTNQNDEFVKRTRGTGIRY